MWFNVVSASCPKSSPVPHEAGVALIGKCWVSERKPSVSLGVISQTVLLKAVFLKKREIGFLPISTYSFVPKRRERRKASLPMAGTLPPRAICAPSLLPTLHPPPHLKATLDGLEMSSNPRTSRGLETSANKADPLQVTSSARTFYSSEISLLPQFTHCKNQHKLSSGRKGADFSLFFFLAKVTAQPVTWRKRGKKSLEKGAKLQVWK